jgi:hypothetical protein
MCSGDTISTTRNLVFSQEVIAESISAKCSGDTISTTRSRVFSEEVIAEPVTAHSCLHAVLTTVGNVISSVTDAVATSRSWCECQAFVEDFSLDTLDESLASRRDEVFRALPLAFHLSASLLATLGANSWIIYCRLFSIPHQLMGARWLLEERCGRRRNGSQIRQDLKITVWS